jgi:hypothetical protein
MSAGRERLPDRRPAAEIVKALKLTNYLMFLGAHATSVVTNTDKVAPGSSSTATTEDRQPSIEPHGAT